jgi:hypothetical protein
MATNQEISLHAEDDDEVQRAARFVAELVRQGITFQARTDVTRGVGGISSVRAVVIEFTGGY